MSSLYFVQYGVNFSHMTEFAQFKLYRDAVKFFDEIDRDKFKSSVCYKQNFKNNGIDLGCVAKSREVKLYKLEPGKDSTNALMAITEGRF
jgi:hypothetical protein